MTELDLLDRNPADIDTPYPRLMDRPTSDAEWTDRIMAQIANPSLLGATPDTDPMAGEIARLRAVDPPINNLGNEMVFLAAGPFAGRATPIAIRAMGSGTAAIRGLTAEAEQALSVYARSMMNRLGRTPTADEVLEYLKLGRHVIEGINHAIQAAPSATKPADQDQNPDWSLSNARWNVDASGQAMLQPNPARALAPSSPEIGIYDMLQKITAEALERTSRINDGLRGVGGRTFQTYTKPHKFSDGIYSGRYSGLGTPEENVVERDRQGYPSPDFYRAKLDQSSKRYSTIRGREQQLIEYYRSLGRSLNKLNGISPYNPLRDIYLRNADEEFGPFRTPAGDASE